MIINIIGLRGDVGKVSLGFQGTNNTFFNILNEKGYKLKQVNDEFILIKKWKHLKRINKIFF